MFKKKDFGDGVICLTSILAENVYLVLGTKQAALIDTSLGTSGSLRKKVKKITSLPLFVINTHGHPDHIGGDGEFTDCDIYLNNKDINLYQNCYLFLKKHHLGKTKATVAPITKALKEGDVFDLGGRHLYIYETPGHTTGSVSIYDDLSHDFFAGDTLTTQTWMHLPHSQSMETYLETIKKIKSLNLPIKRVLSGHPITEEDPKVIDEKIALATAIIANPKNGKPKKTLAGVGLLQKQGKTSIIYNPEKIKKDEEATAKKPLSIF